MVAVAATGACIETGPPQKKIDPAYIAKNLLTEAPATMSNEVGADFGGKVVYLGSDVDTKVATPGGSVKLVHYWKVVAPLGERWRVFTHVQGKAAADWVNADLTDMRIGHGPAEWKAGEIVRDEQTFKVPKTWQSEYLDVLVGLYPKGGQKIEDRMPIINGPADDERRVTAARVSVKLPEQAKPKKSTAYVVRKASAAITIDGRGDEADWQQAAESPAFRDAEGSPEVPGAARARLLWDDEYLYALISVTDPDVYSQYQKQDEPMWREDVVELFIDADGNRHGYVELQVNPNNAHFDAWFATTRAGATDTAWNAEMKSAVVIDGTGDDRDDEDQGWTVEVAIPLAAVKGRDANMEVAIPPALGDRWRLNVVRVDKPKDAKNPVASSWNPITYQDFHALDRMLEVVFGAADGSLEADEGNEGKDGDEPAGSAAPNAGEGAAGASGSP